MRFQPLALARTLSLLLLLLLAPRAIAATEKISIAADDPSLVYYQAADFYRPALSPDGKSIGFIARSNDHARLFKLDRETGAVVGIFDPGEGEVVDFFWLDNNRLLVGGDGLHGLQYFLQTIAPAQTREIRALRKVDADSLQFIPDDPDHVIVNRRQITRVDLLADRGHVIESLTQPNYHGVVSAKGELLAAIGFSFESWQLSWRPNAKSAWQRVKSEPHLLPFFPERMDSDETQILVTAHDQGDASIRPRDSARWPRIATVGTCATLSRTRGLVRLSA